MRAARPDQPVAEWQVWAALGIVYVVWGSTYLAIRVMVTGAGGLPPLLAGGTRHVIAGLIIFALLFLWRGRGALRLRRAELIGGGIVGLLLLLGGNGLVVLGEQQVPSGLTALIVAIVPLCVVVLRCIFREQIATGTIARRRRWLRRRRHPDRARRHQRHGSTRSACSCSSAPRSHGRSAASSPSALAMPHDPLASTGVQMLVGGAALLVVGRLTGEQVHPEKFGFDQVLALVYLITVRQRPRLHGVHVGAASTRPCRASRPTPTSTRLSRSSLGARAAQRADRPDHGHRRRDDHRGRVAGDPDRGSEAARSSRAAGAEVASTPPWRRGLVGA